MGSTAILITPATDQLTQGTGDGEAYRRYWQQKMYKILVGENGR